MHVHEKPRVLLVGLGAVGQAVGAALMSASRCDVVGAVDPGTELVGRPLAEIVPGALATATVVATISEAPSADIAFVATTSFIAQVEPTILELIERDMNVVSICEELGFGFFDHTEIAHRLDTLARQHGVTVLGTGCNPGILMDTLPIALSSLTMDVRHVSMRRSAEMSGYGGILSKFGFGLSEDEFLERREAQDVIGHVGFRESVSALADGLGWKLDEITVDRPEPILVTKHQRVASHMLLEPGTVAAIRHSVNGKIKGRTVIDAAIDFGIFEAADPFPDGGTWRIESDFQTIEFSTGRIDSHISTVAVAANVIPSVTQMPHGLKTMADLPAKSIAARSQGSLV